MVTLGPAPLSRRSAELTDLDLPFDADEPMKSERALELALEVHQKTTAGFDEKSLEILTQVARVQGMQGKVDLAERTLATVAKHLGPGRGATIQLRYALELGRVWTKLRTPARARPLFLEVWDEARRSGRIFLAIDAAQMLAQIEPPKDRIQWIESALALAEADRSAAAPWLSSLHATRGWHYFELLQHEKARGCFERAAEEVRSQSDVRRELAASCAVGRTLRALQRFPEALAIQTEVLARLDRAKAVDGLVHEEIAECLTRLNRSEEAKRHFAIAHEQLSKDSWLKDNESGRLSRLKKLGGVPNRPS